MGMIKCPHCGNEMYGDNLGLSVVGDVDEGYCGKCGLGFIVKTVSISVDYEVTCLDGAHDFVEAIGMWGDNIVKCSRCSVQGIIEPKEDKDA